MCESDSGCAGTILTLGVIIAILYYIFNITSVWSLIWMSILIAIAFGIVMWIIAIFLFAVGLFILFLCYSGLSKNKERNCFDWIGDTFTSIGNSICCCFY